MATEEKKKKVSFLKEKFEKANSLALSNYRGLSANEMNEMREYFTKEGVEYRVVKNTLAQIAAQQAGLEDTERLFDGPIGIAIGYDDPVLPFKISVKCEKDFKKYENKGGLLEREFVAAEEVEDVAQLSSREELLGNVARAFNAPIQKLAVVLQAKVSDLVSVIDQVKKKKE